ncbi:LuxR C-terminal-related transcriptional regulator [Arthrobacter sp. MYb227]|uniref:helix-turn-helix transcriptional regulator n=1 Tax=Arthrobacter sp. MYb227 TaxID=1848601 RepID=UPI0015E3018D|nr:LuxR C-terminal-related transcriptional regulator [Arthrobacter sp. MYb227]
MSVLGLGDLTAGLRMIEPIGPNSDARSGLFAALPTASESHVVGKKSIQEILENLCSSPNSEVAILDSGLLGLVAPATFGRGLPLSAGFEKHRIVFAEEACCQKSPPEIAFGMSAESFELRVASRIPATLVIRDQEEALLLGPLDAQGLPAGVHIKSKWIAAFLYEIFETTWNAAAPCAKEPKDEEHLFSNEEQEILRLLNGGLTDESIARSFGVSHRTIQRKVQQIQRRIGAISRFQLGAMTAA